MNLHDQPPLVLLKISEYLNPPDIFVLPLVCKPLWSAFYTVDRKDFLTTLVGDMLERHYEMSWRDAILFMESMNTTEPSAIPLSEWSVSHKVSHDHTCALAAGQECGGHDYENRTNSTRWCRKKGGKRDVYASCCTDASPINVWRFVSSLAGDWINVLLEAETRPPTYLSCPTLGYFRMPCRHAALSDEHSRHGFQRVCVDASMWWHNDVVGSGSLTQRSQFHVYADSKCYPQTLFLEETTQLQALNAMALPGWSVLHLVHSNVLLGAEIAYEAMREGQQRRYTYDYYAFESMVMLRRELYTDRNGAARLAERLRTLGADFYGTAAQMTRDAYSEYIARFKWGTDPLMLGLGPDSITLAPLHLSITRVFDESSQSFVTETPNAVASLMRFSAELQEELKSRVHPLGPPLNSVEEHWRDVATFCDALDAHAYDTARRGSISIAEGLLEVGEGQVERKWFPSRIYIVDELHLLLVSMGMRDNALIFGKFCGGGRLLLYSGHGLQRVGTAGFLSGVLINESEE